MKSLGVILAHLSTPLARRNVRVVIGLHVVLLVVVAAYSGLFHLLMAREGQSHSWPTSIYWTFVTMSTLGFGDITFQSDLGRLFSVLVLMTGAIFILVLLPFTFIQFIYVPLMEARQAARAPRSLPKGTSGHVILTGTGDIEDALIQRLDRAGISYAMLVGDLPEALNLHDRGYRVMVGEIDDPSTYRAARVEGAALVATTRADTTNTNIAFTVREINDAVHIVATANSPDSVDILELAGCNQVLHLGDLLGRALAQRVLEPDGRSQVIGRFGDLLIAEAAAPPSLVGQAIRESDLRQRLGMNVAGIAYQGTFAAAEPDTVVRPRSVLVLAGTSEELAAYDAAYERGDAPGGPVVVIGAGRVGRAAAAALAEVGIPHRIIERNPGRIRDPSIYVEGDAAELAVLQRAGIEAATSVVITTHDDDINVYLTIYCRRLRPEAQVIARANVDRNVTTLRRAGADFVLSYASTGATAIWNTLSADDTVQLAEGLDVFRVPVPTTIAGRTLADSRIRSRTGCTVIAVVRGGVSHANPAPADTLPPGGDLVLIGESDAESRFLGLFGNGRR